MLKTHNCGELRATHAGQEITLAGWVHRRRDLGELIFIDLRDRWGITQIAIDSKTYPDAHRIGSDVRNEYVVQIRGKVRARPEGMTNPNMPTGEIEVEATAISTKKTRWTKISASSTAILISVASGCSATSSSAPAWSNPSATIYMIAVSSRSRRRSCSRPRPKAHVTISCLAASIPANSTRYHKARSS